ncbi:hypothetical protein N780_01925 [Pontibacillus chungwhensis BH030062]|uniref:Uncharacterized protein n=1 Tax=Pontibacillus chungwhensis BH030062 TaxID=1385513 RepID=A0A0A2UWX2_9BACI|nr:hypothetical protein [Pontibacillus chungwhensis]KGP92399.1 hypothetical protein N780_01925 [Pontibacillus chungwhensis BH030062]
MSEATILAIVVLVLIAVSAFYNRLTTLNFIWVLLIFMLEFAANVYISMNLSLVFGRDGSGLVLFPGYVLMGFILILILNKIFFPNKGQVYVPRNLCHVIKGAFE